MDYVDHLGLVHFQFQIPQGFIESDEEDELYEEVKDIPGNYIVG